MPKIPSPPGTVTREVAVRVLIREKIITSSPMLTKLRGIERVVPEGRSHGYYKEDQLLKIINDRRKLHGQPTLTGLFYEDHSIAFRQATSEDMPGVYNIAVKLFGTTTPANDRIPLLNRCPEGNVVVTDNDQVVGFAHLYPMLQEPLSQFLAGRFRGRGIVAEHLDPFETGKVVDLLIKSMGTYHESLFLRRRYSKMLFVGLRHEAERWGLKGYIIRKIYATSETQSGIELAADFRMKSLGRIPGSKGQKRYAFELDPCDSGHPIIQDYCKALEVWRGLNPEE
jgi:hypothetical protein